MVSIPDEQRLVPALVVEVLAAPDDLPRAAIRKFELLPDVLFTVGLLNIELHEHLPTVLVGQEPVSTDATVADGDVDGHALMLGATDPRRWGRCRWGRRRGRCG